MMDIVWNELREEFLSLGAPGTLWRREILVIAKRKINKLRNVPPETFGFTDWDIEDLTQNVIADRLIGRNQAEYIVDVSETVDDARRLLTVEVNFTLEDRRLPSQVDNVYDNLVSRLELLGWNPSASRADSFEVVGTQIGHLSRLLLSHKRLKNRGVTRHSALFASAVLDGLAREIFDFEPDLSPDTLKRAIRQALTIISPALSIESVGTSAEDFSESGGMPNSKEDKQLVPSESDYELAHSICQNFGPEELEILYLLASGASQQVIAESLGVSRPTGVKRISEFSIKFNEILDTFQVQSGDEIKLFRATLDLLGVGMIEGELTK